MRAGRIQRVEPDLPGPVGGGTFSPDMANPPESRDFCKLASKRSNKGAPSEAAQGGGRERTPADLIVAVGASGAISQPVERFLSHLAIDQSMTVVLVFQHREALDEERFSRILAEHQRELSLAADGVPLEAGRIYWSAPNTILTVEDGHFQSRTAQEAPGERGTIDSFLVSVAPDQDKDVVGIIFSGTGGDGILGFGAIKEAGGLTLTEETD